MNNLNLGQELDQIALNYLTHELDQKMHWNTKKILKRWEYQLRKEASKGKLVIPIKFSFNYDYWYKYGIKSYGNIGWLDGKLKVLITLWVTINGLTLAEDTDWNSPVNMKPLKIITNNTIYEFGNDLLSPKGEYNLRFSIDLRHQ